MAQTVLVADSDRDVREAMVKAAEGLDVAVEWASTVDDAFRIFLEKGAQAVFVEALLPRKGAFELIKRIRKVPGGEKVAVYVTTAMRSTAALKDEALRTWKALGLLTKPVTVELLRRELEKTLLNSSAVEERAVVSARVPEEGNFDRSSFPLVFSHAMLSRDRCRLMVMQGKIKKVLYFSGGDLVFARSNVFSETLARHLLNRGMVDDHGYQCAIEMVLETGIRIGEAFIALGQVDEVTVDVSVRRNILEKTLDVFTWSKGWYRLIDFEEPPAPMPGGPISSGSVLWTVLNEFVDPASLGGALSSLSARKTRQGKNLKDAARGVDFGSAGKYLEEMTLLAGRGTLGDLLKGAGNKRPELLYYLILTGVMEIVGGGKDQPEDEIDPDAREWNESILRLAADLSGKNSFQILGLGLDCTDEQVVEALARVKGDRFTKGTPKVLTPRVKEALEEQDALFEAAAASIATAELRAEYMTMLTGVREETQEGVGELRAESFFREGVEALRMQDWVQATDRFRQAVALNPAEPEYLMYMGISRMHETFPSKEAALSDAEGFISEAQRAMPSKSEPFYQLGRIAEFREDLVGACMYFEKALRLDPSHARSQRRLRSLQKHRSLLSGIFKGKR